jgi:hypothetical protein
MSHSIRESIARIIVHSHFWAPSKLCQVPNLLVFTAQSVRLEAAVGINRFIRHLTKLQILHQITTPWLHHILVSLAADKYHRLIHVEGPSQKLHRYDCSPCHYSSAELKVLP